MSKYINLIALVLISSLVLCQGLAAEEEEKIKLPTSGTLSASFRGNQEGKSVDGQWGSNQKKAAPIAGSVSRKSAREWIAKVFNNSEDNYHVSLQVVQFNEKGSTTKRDNFSMVLRAGETKERVVKSSLSTRDAKLRLRSWNNLTERNKKEEEVAEERKKAQMKKQPKSGKNPFKK